jgi:hypothetical protein
MTAKGLFDPCEQLGGWPRVRPGHLRSLRTAEQTGNNVWSNGTTSRATKAVE